MLDSSDMELLQDYARRNSEPAFETLVSRHINLVYSVALRSVGNPAQAEEITQAVFIILARKAARLHKDASLSGWMYETARLTSAAFWRGELRRIRREQEAFNFQRSTSNVQLPTFNVQVPYAPLRENCCSGKNHLPQFLASLDSLPERE
jgi:DNA-directed RNA polymerase specialized sigma24 family protein